jgi:U4/U6 small nuclear ribonucleoprotein SNU13
MSDKQPGLLSLLIKIFRISNRRTAIKTLRRSTAELVILAADTMPIYIVLSLTISAEEKNCPYIYVPSKVALGRACGLDRPVIAASITTNRAGELAAQIHELREKVSTMAI